MNLFTTPFMEQEQYILLLNIVVGQFVSYFKSNHHEYFD